MLALVEVGIFAIVLGFTAVFSWILPGITRRDILFGVTVAPNTRAMPAGRALIRRYRLQVGALAALGALGLALTYALAPASFWRSGWTAALALAPVLLLEIPYLVAYSAARALRAPTSDVGAGPCAGVETSAALRPRRYGDYVPWIWEALPPALIAATAAVLASSYAAAPAIIATHFDAAGTANAFAPKTIGTYFALVWTQLGLEVLLTVLAVLVVGAKAQPGRANEGFRRAGLRYLYLVKVLTLALLGGTALLITGAATSGTTSRRASLGLLLPLTLGFAGAVLLGGLVVALRAGQGGSRLGDPAETATDRTDDRYWKLGVIYANRDDPSLFVERRFGFGWTVNVANPLALLLLVGILALALLPALIPLLTAGR